jgi:hypothetical protein
VQLGSECHPGSIGFVYEEFLAITDARDGRIKSALKTAFRRNIMKKQT